MIKAEVQWLQRNDLTRLDYDAGTQRNNLINWIKGNVEYHELSVVTRGLNPIYL